MMKQSVIGSKFINFEYNSKTSQRVFPSNLENKPCLPKRYFDKNIGYHGDWRTVEVEIVVLQVETQVVSDKLHYLIEYIEKE